MLCLSVFLFLSSLQIIHILDMLGIFSNNQFEYIFGNFLAMLEISVLIVWYFLTFFLLACKLRKSDL